MMIPVNGRAPSFAEARTLMRLFTIADDPKLSVVARSIDEDLGEIERAGPRNTRKTIAVRKRLAENVDDFTEVIKRNPKYSNIEFKCLDDYDKCRKHRGKNSLLCIISYIICIGRRIIPLVRHT
jgi:hypothetical protein